MSDGDLSVDAVYQPWRPVLGARVRVRLSGECPLWNESINGCLPHRMDEDGAVGTVMVTDIHVRLKKEWARHGLQLKVHPCHPYEVTFDQKLPSGPVRGHFAATELELESDGPSYPVERYARPDELTEDGPIRPDIDAIRRGPEA